MKKESFEKYIRLWIWKANKKSMIIQGLEVAEELPLRIQVLLSKLAQFLPN